MYNVFLTQIHISILNKQININLALNIYQRYFVNVLDF
jgi:hypothetical protein